MNRSALADKAVVIALLRRSWVFVLAVLLGAGTLCAQNAGNPASQQQEPSKPLTLPDVTPQRPAPPLTDRWLRVTSPHFTIVTDAGEKRGRELALYLEQMRAAFGDLLLEGKLPQGAPLVVLAVKTSGELYDFGLKMDRGRPIGSLVLDSGDIFAEEEPLQSDVALFDVKVGEVYLHDSDRDFALLNLSSVKPWRAFMHAYTHQLLDANLAPLPRWFAEGFAQYMSVVRIEQDPPEKKHGKDLPPTYHAVTPLPPSLPPGEQFAIADLFPQGEAISQASDPINAKTYTAAWREVAFLFDSHQIAQAKKCFALVRQKVPVEEAIEQAFGVTAAELDRQAGVLFAARAEHRKPVPGEEPDITVNEMPDAQRRNLARRYPSA